MGNGLSIQRYRRIQPIHKQHKGLLCIPFRQAGDYHKTTEAVLSQRFLPPSAGITILRIIISLIVKKKQPCVRISQIRFLQGHRIQNLRIQSAVQTLQTIGADLHIFSLSLKMYRHILGQFRGNNAQSPQPLFTELKPYRYVAEQNQEYNNDTKQQAQQTNQT